MDEDKKAELLRQAERVEDDKKWQAQLEQLEVAEGLRQQLDSMVVNLTERVKALSQEMARKNDEAEVAKNQHKEDAEELKRLRSSGGEAEQLRIELGKQKQIADEASAQLKSQEQRLKESEDKMKELRSQADKQKTSSTEETAASALKSHFEKQLAEQNSQLEQWNRTAGEIRTHGELQKKEAEEAAEELRGQLKSQSEKLKVSEDEIVELKSQLKKQDKPADEAAQGKASTSELTSQLAQQLAEQKQRTDQQQKAAEEARSQVEEHRKAADKATEELKSQMEKHKVSADEIAKLKSRLQSQEKSVDEDSLSKLKQAETSREKLEQRVTDLRQQFNAVSVATCKPGDDVPLSPDRVFAAKLHSVSADDLRALFAGLAADQHQKLKTALGPDIIVSEDGLRAFDKAEKQREGLAKRVAELTQKLAAMEGERRTIAEPDAERLTREPELERQLQEAEQKRKELAERVEKLAGSESTEAELKQKLSEAEEGRKQLTDRVANLAKRVDELMATPPSTDTVSGEAASKVDEDTLEKLKTSEELGKVLESRVAELQGSIKMLQAANQQPSDQVPAAVPSAMHADASAVEAAAMLQLKDAEAKREQLARSVTELHEKVRAMDAREASAAEQLADAMQKLEEKGSAETELKRKLQDAEKKIKELEQSEGCLPKHVDQPVGAPPASEAATADAAAKVDEDALGKLKQSEALREDLEKRVARVQQSMDALKAANKESRSDVPAASPGAATADAACTVGVDAVKKLEAAEKQREELALGVKEMREKVNVMAANEAAATKKLSEAEQKGEQLEARVSALTQRLQDLLQKQATNETSGAETAGKGITQDSPELLQATLGQLTDAETKREALENRLSELSNRVKELQACADGSAKQVAEAGVAPDPRPLTTSATTAAPATASAAPTAAVTVPTLDTSVAPSPPLPPPSTEPLPRQPLQPAPFAPEHEDHVKAPGSAPPPLLLAATGGTSAAPADGSAATSAVAAGDNAAMRDNPIVQGDSSTSTAKVEQLARSQAAPDSKTSSGTEEVELRIAKTRIKEAIGSSLASGVLEDTLTSIMQDTEPAKMRIKEHVASALESGKLDEELKRVAQQGPTKQQDISDLKTKLKLALEEKAASEGGLTGILSDHDYGIASS